MADNEKAYHEIAANTTCEFVIKELLQELDKTRNASMLEDEDIVVHNLKSYLASFKRNNNVHKKILLNVQGWVLKGKTVFIPSSKCNGFQCNGWKPLNLFLCNNPFMTITCYSRDVGLKFMNVLWQFEKVKIICKL
jgi:hypothetical protein